MDKFNVIKPTDNLDELNKDMMDWYYLPLSMRYRSDDDCRRLYGCTNIELYNKIKMAILSQKDRDNVEKDNLMKAVDEATNEFDLMNQEMLLAMSKKLQLSPNIVIIDPDISSLEELNIRYNKYTLLLDKYKRFSDNYSLQLWGYNVISMYHMMRGKLSLDVNDIDSNNIMVDNVSESINEYANSLVVDDIFNKYIIEDNQLGLCKLKLDYLEDDIPTAIKERYKECFDNIDIDFCDEVALPRITPWFTPDEIVFANAENSILDPQLENLSMRGYAQAVSRSMSNYIKYRNDENRNKLLSLGWNPEVDITKESIAFAKERQKKFCMKLPLICNLEVVNLPSINSNKLSFDNNCPIFIVAEIQPSENGTKKVSKLGISFGNIRSSMYVFSKDSNNILTFVKDKIENFNEVIIFNTFADSKSFELISTACARLAEHTNALYRISGSIYDIIGNSVDLISDSYRILVANVLYKLVQFASYEINGDDIEFSPCKFTISNVDYIYRLYSGNAKDFTEDECTKLVKILLDKEIRGEFAFTFANVESYNISENSDKIREIYKEILSILTPSNSIIYRGE